MEPVDHMAITILPASCQDVKQDNEHSNQGIFIYS